MRRNLTTLEQDGWAWVIGCGDAVGKFSLTSTRAANALLVGACRVWSNSGPKYGTDGSDVKVGAHGAVFTIYCTEPPETIVDRLVHASGKGEQYPCCDCVYGPRCSLVSPQCRGPEFAMFMDDE